MFVMCTLSILLSSSCCVLSFKGPWAPGMPRARVREGERGPASGREEADRKDGGKPYPCVFGKKEQR